MLNAFRSSASDTRYSMGTWKKPASFRNASIEGFSPASIFEMYRIVGQIETGLIQWVLDNKRRSYRIIINKNTMANLRFLFNINNDIVDYLILQGNTKISHTGYVSNFESRSYELQLNDNSRCLIVRVQSLIQSK